LRTREKLLEKFVLFLNNVRFVESPLLVERIKHGNVYFSQTGEDIILNMLFTKKDGFYVDVGCHHPTRFSNTLLLYRRGWHGINIDADYRNMREFENARKRDINLNLAVSDTEEVLPLNLFDESAVSTFSSNWAKRMSRAYKSSPRKVLMRTTTLAKTLDKYLPKNTRIDFLNIDVEGYDFKVLRSNNWEKYRPSYVLIEMFDSPSGSKRNKSIDSYLRKRGYEFLAKTLFSAVYKKIR